MMKQEPTKDPLVQVTIRVPESLRDKVLMKAKNDRRTFASKVTLLLEKALAQEEGDKELAS